MGFESQWVDWQPKGPIPGPDKTDKSPSVSFVSGSPRRISPVEGASVSFVSASPKHILPLEEGTRPSKAPKARPDKTDKRYSAGGTVVLLEAPDDVPEAWAQGVANLLVMPAVTGWSPARWAILQEDARVFLDTWGGQADRLGWTAHDLFSVHPEASYARVDAMGLLPLLGGRRVVALCEESTTIEVSGGTRSFRRRRLRTRECCLIWNLSGPL
jgi:hypothetical protein